MKVNFKLLYIEHQTGDALLAEEVFKSKGFSCEICVVAKRQHYEGALTSFNPDVIIAHQDAATLSPFSALTILTKKGIKVPFIVVADTTPLPNEISSIVEIMQLGASDYILKNELNRLPDATVKASQKKVKADTLHDGLSLEKTDNAMVLSEQRYRQIVETAQEGIWIIDENLVTTFANKKLCDMFGYTLAEIIGKHNYDFKDERGKADTFSRIDKLRTGDIETHESKFITKSGNEILCSVTTNGLFDEKGNFLGTLGMMTDITQRKADEESLKRSEANLSAIIENTTDLVYSLDDQCRFITFNQVFKNTMKAVYGFDIEQGVNVLDQISALDQDLAKKWEHTYGRALGGETLQFVNEYPFGDGKVYMSYSINPIRESGKVIGLSCFSRDITRQKLDEAAIKKSEASLRTTFNNTDMGCALIDSDQNVVSFNPLAEKLAFYLNGLNIKEGVPLLDCISPERKKYVLEVLAKVKNGTSVNYQLERVVDGGIKWFDVTWAGIKDNDHGEFGYIFTCKDITEKKKLEIEREQIINDLLQRNKALEQFTYIISHNLRAPVANIMGLSSLITSSENDKAEVAQITSSINLSANKLDTVITDLNQILQVNENKNELVERIQISTIVSDIKHSIKHLIDKEQVDIICDVDSVDELYSLKSFIYSIFYNLILNSIKYRKTGVNPVIRISTALHDGKLRITFKDNGRGIDTKKYAKELFGLYKRFDNTVDGKGMGLFMVKMQTESLGGSISLKSTPNEGSEFYLEFPQTRLTTSQGPL